MLTTFPDFQNETTTLSGHSEAVKRLSTLLGHKIYLRKHISQTNKELGSSDDSRPTRTRNICSAWIRKPQPQLFTRPPRLCTPQPRLFAHQPRFMTPSFESMLACHVTIYIFGFGSISISTEIQSISRSRAGSHRKIDWISVQCAISHLRTHALSTT